MTFIVLFISHIEPVVYSPILPAREPGPSVLEPTTDSVRGRHAFGRSAWRVDSPGGSLRAGRPRAVCSRVHSGGQRRLHRQAAQESDPASAPKGPCPGPADQRLGGASLGGTTSRCSAPWVEAVLNASWLCNYNPCRIVWPHKRWPKHTACWCPRQTSRSRHR